MTLPSFLCIGATKAGTTWLHDQFATHPGICMPVVKELHYFNARLIPGHRRWAEPAVRDAFERELRRARQRVVEGDLSARDAARHLKAVMAHEMFTPAWYEASFDRPGADRLPVGEITPAYAELDEAGIQALLAFLPGVRLVHILRHPFDRALSHLRMDAYRSATAPGEDALMALLDRNPQIFTRGDYHLQLPLWKRLVPAERRLVLPFGRIKKEPLVLLAEVERFVGAAPFNGYRPAEAVNTTRPIDIPPAVRERITQRVQPTIDFLRAEFGEAFLEATR